MKHETLTYRAADGTPIFAYRWLPDSEIKAVLQIAHGMSEHAKRYEEFAVFLTGEGYAVYANDHRGHGQTAGEMEKLGYFSDLNGWETVVEDMKGLNDMIHTYHGKLPIYLLGHSMGSFLSRRYIQKYGEQLAGVILSGTGADSGILGTIAVMIAKWEMKTKGQRVRSDRLNYLSFGRFNKNFQPARTAFDWLTRDEEQVDLYRRDPYCGYIVTSSFFRDMLTGLKMAEHKDNLLCTPKTLPMYFISGSMDPVGGETKGVLKVIRKYEKAGIVDIEKKFYEGARHEVLKEINKEEVFQDILNWLGRKMPADASEMAEY